MRWLAAGGGAVVMFTATRACAHVSVEGLSDFPAGLVHPLLTLPHALALLAFGLLCGGHEAALLRPGLPSLLVGLVGGLALGWTGLATPALSIVLTLLAAIIGAAVALDLRLPTWSAILLGGGAGFAIGLDSFPEGTFAAQAAALGGTLFGVVLLALNAAGLAAFAKAEWQLIGIRIAGSWISAAAFLNIALLFRK